MKKLTITKFIRTYKKVFEGKIPKEGILIEKANKPIAVIIRPNEEVKKAINEEITAKAIEAVRKVKLDTFTEVEVKDLETSLGKCTRCGTQGPVVKKGYLLNGTIKDGWLCVKNCYSGEKTPPKELSKVELSDMTVSRSDFGRSNV